MPGQGLEVVAYVLVHGCVMDGFIACSSVPWLPLFSQVLRGRCVHHHPWHGRLRDGAAGHRAPDHPPWHRPLLETSGPVWKCQRGDSLPRHQDCEHLCQSRGPRWLEEHRYKLMLACGTGSLKSSQPLKSYFRTTVSLPWQGIYNSKINKPGKKADK